MGSYPLGAITHDIVRDAQWRRPEDVIVRIGPLTEGWSIKTKFVSDALDAENTIAKKCKDFKNVLLAMEGYGGHEEVEI